MGDNAFKMLVQNTAEPEEVLVLRDGADVHDVGNCLRHSCLVSLLVGTCQLVLHDVQRKEKLVLLDKSLVPLNIPRFADNNRLGE